ncbi:tyrosine--tRNA ligase 1, cytoplasmic-like isoform X2 [Phragmites australis]|uniref:tyrosine--tRNA ligase 1, cytoplasmic-like isoform X2 n=1 Tax=Phragmites australis TaxID=29695 RepID=UPI002D7975DE|nr:tyrosine--tRNA ligase 1, cytoplasmic-like isoform X2 [Phragmites australis]XP_062222929.1 tyrosine--tRNA ligase 1, cytoplasmic-like isoform X2 [Phragmites australis]
MDNSSASPMDIYRETMGMSLVDRFTVLTSIGDECIQEDELWFLLKRKATPVCYVWFEPSTPMNITEGILKAIYVNKMVKAGFTVKVMIADLFALIYKYGYNLDQVRTVGSYNIEMWKAAGMDLERVELVWFSDELNHHPANYWPLAFDVSRKSTVDQIARCCSIMESFLPDLLPGAELLYPCLQIAAILSQKADMWLFSTDQRDASMIARSYAENIKGQNKPIILLHNMLPSLLEKPELQRRGDPARTVFMEDGADILSFKMEKAFCPPKLALGNPCLEYIKYVIFPLFGKFEVVQEEMDGGTKTFSSMEELVVDYESGVVDSANVKLAFEKSLNKILQPVHDYFWDNKGAMALFCSLKEYQRARRE